MPGVEDMLAELNAPDLGAVASDAMAMVVAQHQQAQAQAAFDADLRQRKLDLHNHMRRCPAVRTTEPVNRTALG